MNRRDDMWFRREVDFYNANAAEITRKYRGRYIAIKDTTIIGAYDTFPAAMVGAGQRHRLGTFFIMKVKSRGGAQARQERLR
jgi:hypothetical protein